MADGEQEKQNAPASTEAAEETDEEASIEEEDDEGGGLTSPEGIVMLIVAGIFDLIGLVPLVNDVSDIIAGIFFSIWMMGTSKKGWWKFLIAFILEAIPIVSDITPVVSIIGILFNVKLPTSWTGCVFSILTGGSGTEKSVVAEAK